MFICHVRIQTTLLGEGEMGERHVLLLPLNACPIYSTYIVDPSNSVLRTP